MDSFEKNAFHKGFCNIAGVDEAGRGPLAGPVVAAAVIFPYPPPKNPHIRDSKTLTRLKRKKVLFEIFRSASAVGIGVVWHDEVDSINIHRASLKAMQKAVESLSITPGILLIDGPFTINSSIAQKPIVDGDALSTSIAAASIVAKTTRDSIMDAYHRLYPHYNFRRNNGYGTIEHLSALREIGPCPIHRRSFKWAVREK